MSSKTKKSSSSLIKLVAIIAAVAIVGAGIIFAISHFSDSPKSAVNRLESACNDRDIEKIIECLDPQSQSQAKSLLNLAGAFLGEESLTDMADELFDLGELIDDEDDIKNAKIKFDVNDVKKDGDEAEVDVTIRIYDGSGELLSESDETIDTVKVDGKWYIDGSDIIGSLL